MIYDLRQLSDTEGKNFGEVSVRRSFDGVKTGEIDSHGNDVYDWKNLEDKGWKIYLNHSCDEWVIEGVDKAKEMAKNLLEAIAYCDANP